MFLKLHGIHKRVHEVDRANRYAQSQAHRHACRHAHRHACAHVSKSIHTQELASQASHVLARVDCFKRPLSHNRRLLTSRFRDAGAVIRDTGNRSKVPGDVPSQKTQVARTSRTAWTSRSLTEMAHAEHIRRLVSPLLAPAAANS